MVFRLTGDDTQIYLTKDIFDDGEYTPVDLPSHKLESLDVDGLYDAIVEDLNKARKEL